MMMYKKLGLLLTTLLLVGCGNKSRSNSDGIYPYDPALDREMVAQQLTLDRYWLVADEMVTYNPMDTVDTGIHVYTRKPVTFLVYQMSGRPVGFVSYYKKTDSTGVIQFLDVVPAYRGKGISRKLMLTALDALRDESVSKIEIVVRVNNKRAIELYSSLGFVYAYGDHKYAWYEKPVRF